MAIKEVKQSGGSDTGSTGPFATIAYGISKIGSSDGLRVYDGFYDTGIDSVPSGSSFAYTRIFANPGSTVWLRPSSNPNGGSNCIWLDGAYHHIEFDGINLDGRDCDVSGLWVSTNNDNDPHHIRFKNATILPGDVGAGAAVLLGNHTLIGATGGNEVLNCTITGGGLAGLCGFGCANYGVYIAGPNNLVAGCDIYDTSGAGIQIYNGSGDSPDNNIVRDNRIHDITRAGTLDEVWGILVYGVNNKIYRNLIYRIHVGNTLVGLGGLAVTGSGHKLWSNTIYDVYNSGIRIDSAASGVEVRNNVVYLAAGTYFSDAGSGTTKDHNLTDGTDPGFVDAAAGDFRITSASAAYHAGVVVTDVPTDFAGVTYASPPSKGAYEVDETIGETITMVIGDNSDDDIAGLDDTYIDSLNPTSNFGSNELLGVYKYLSNEHLNALIRAPGISAVPSGLTVVGAVLRLYQSLTNAGESVDITIGAKRALVEWTQLGSTWGKYDGVTNWNTAGGLGSGTDIGASSDGSAVISPALGYYDLTLNTALVQGWHDGSIANNGALLQRTDDADDGLYSAFVSSRGADGQRPQLRLTLAMTVSSSALMNMTQLACA